jgi:hypothetical protein
MMHTMERFFTLTTGNVMTDHIALGRLQNGREVRSDRHCKAGRYEARSEISGRAASPHNP